jgi:hypothetical protein
VESKGKIPPQIMNIKGAYWGGRRRRDKGSGKGVIEG